MHAKLGKSKCRVIEVLNLVKGLVMLRSSSMPRELIYFMCSSWYVATQHYQLWYMYCGCALDLTESWWNSTDFADYCEARSSPSLQHITKHDISLPTKTAGPLFTSQLNLLDSDDEIEDEGRAGSTPLEETLRPSSVQELARERVRFAVFCWNVW